MVSVPVRVSPVLASKVNVARPLPAPLDEVCSQEALDVAVHAPPVTMSESLPAAGASTSVETPSDGAACVTAICWPRTVMSAVRAAPVFPVNE